MASKATTNDSEVREALERFRESQDGSQFSRDAYHDDTNFARLSEQWPDEVKRQRLAEGRPCLTINKLPAFIRQVVNDSRQNKPAIKVSPVDNGADVDTAQVISGLIRSIERGGAGADVAYDTAIDHAVSGGFGFFRIAVDYAHEDSFDMECRIERIPNPLMVHWDISSTHFDASDWEYAFVSELLTEEVFKQRYPKASPVSFQHDERDYASDWVEDEHVRIAEYWLRTEKTRELIQFATPDGNIRAIREDDLPRMGRAMAEAGGLDLSGMKDSDVSAAFIALNGLDERRRRKVTYNEVTRRIMTGAEVLDEDPWPGSTIPICPVWGEEIYLDGKRHFRSMIRDAKDPQLMFNFWRALALDTPIPTPNGWTTMGEIQVGDELFDETGRVCSVIGKSPVHTDKDCYRIEFTDGTSIVASGDHPWVVEERAGRNAKGFVWETKKLTTEDLMPGDHFIDVAGALKTAPVSLPIHPYVFGQWIGDGSASCGRITSNGRDADKIKGLIASLGYECSPSYEQNNSHTYTVYGISPVLREMGVIGNKGIPPQYLRASVEQRWALLQGLMDSDGSYNPSNNACGFVTSDDGIARSFGELLSSLGFKHTHVVRDPRNGCANGIDIVGTKVVYQFSFTAYDGDPVFGIRRPFPDGVKHQRRTKRYGIKSVTQVGRVPVQCIGIDAESHLFLAGQSMIPTHNSATTELVALAPRAPFMVEEGAIPKGPEGNKWQSANTRSHPYLMYSRGQNMPQRQAFAGVPAGALQEAMNASDDIKAVTGMFDAALGARSNETSGRAILARKAESDNSNFHFVDNLSRAIRYAGQVLVEIIPSVYGPRQTIRILGEDMAEKVVKLTQEDGGSNQEGIDGEARLYNLSLGKYDVTVATGPSYSTQREETREALVEIMSRVPDAAPILGDVLMEHLDFPGADVVAKRLKTMLPPAIQQAEGLAPPAQPPAPNPEDEARNRELDIKAYDAETKRITAMSAGISAEQVQALVMQTIKQVMASPDILPPGQASNQPPMGESPMPQEMPGQLPPNMAGGMPAPQPGQGPMGGPDPRQGVM